MQTLIDCAPDERLVIADIDNSGCEIWACQPSNDEPHGSPEPAPEPGLQVGPRDPSLEATVTWSESQRYRQENIILSEDRLSVHIEEDSVNDTVLADAFTSTGRWYWEVTLNGYAESSYNGIGVCADGQITEMGPSFDGGVSDEHGGRISAYEEYVNGFSYSAGDTVGVILDAARKKVWFIVQGMLVGGGHPVRGTGGISIDPTKARWAPCLNTSQGYRYRANFGQEDWVYGQPTGFTIPHEE